MQTTEEAATAVSEKRSLLSCYKLSDYHVEDYCKVVWNAGTNAEYRTALAESPVVKPVLAYFTVN